MEIYILLIQDRHTDPAREGGRHRGWEGVWELLSAATPGLWRPRTTVEAFINLGSAIKAAKDYLKDLTDNGYASADNIEEKHNPVDNMTGKPWCEYYATYLCESDSITIRKVQVK
jgi:hypothetical protein